jgi:hypothetical protein
MGPPVSFLSLPTELRLQIYRLTLPHCTRIKFRTSGHSWPRDGRDDSPPTTLRVSTGLFRVNRIVSEESKDVFYGENEFEFRIDGYESRPVAEQIFGPLGRYNRLSLLRRLRRIKLYIQLSSAKSSITLRHRTRIQKFVAAFGEMEGEQCAALEHLKVEFDPFVSDVRGCRFLGYHRMPELRWQYPLEELTKLPVVSKVEIEGVDDWFAQCLEKAITRTGGDLHEIQYPKIERKRKRPGGKKKSTETLTSKTWEMPTYNWDEFAEKNDVPLPTYEIIGIRRKIEKGRPTPFPWSHVRRIVSRPERVHTQSGKKY